MPKSAGLDGLDAPAVDSLRGENDLSTRHGHFDPPIAVRPDEDVVTRRDVSVHGTSVAVDPGRRPGAGQATAAASRPWVRVLLWTNGAAMRKQIP